MNKVSFFNNLKKKHLNLVKNEICFQKYAIQYKIT